MLQVTTSLIFAAAACAGIGVIFTMLKHNGAAILSALAGHGAFPANPSPEKGPSAHMVFISRPSRRTVRRRANVSHTSDLARGISYAA